MARSLTKIILKVVGSVYQPDSGHTVTIKTDEGVPVLVTTAVETPASSGNYIATWTEQEKYGYWYVDDSIKSEWGRIWLGTVVGNVNYLNNFDILGTLNVNGAFNLSGSMTIDNSTLVTNLNSDLLDGLHASAFLLVNNTGSINHANLQNLDYTVSGHTGFAGTGVVNQFSQNQIITGSVLVTGSVITDKFQMKSGAVNGYVLTSDSNGNASWMPSGSGGGTTDHAALTNLAYSVSGHTGFAGTGVVNQFSQNQVITGSIYTLSPIFITGSLASSAITSEPFLMVHRPFNGGVSFPEIVQFNIGSYATGVGSESKFEIFLKSISNGVISADKLVATFQSNNVLDLPSGIIQSLTKIGVNIGASVLPDIPLQVNSRNDALRGNYVVTNWNSSGQTVPAMFNTPTDNGGNSPAALFPAIVLARVGVGGQKYDNFVDFRIGTYQSGLSPATALAIGLYNIQTDTTTNVVQVMFSDGRVAVGNVNSITTSNVQNNFEVFGTSRFNGDVIVTGSVFATGSLSIAPTFISSPGLYTVLSKDYVIFASASSGDIHIQLPPINISVGRHIKIKKIDSSANNVHISGSSGQLIDANTVQSLTTQYASLSIIGASTQWYII
jgi:hypothetical protein